MELDKLTSASSYPASVQLAQACPNNSLPRLHFKFSLLLSECRHLSAKLGNHRGLPQDLSSAFSYLLHNHASPFPSQVL